MSLKQWKLKLQINNQEEQQIIEQDKKPSLQKQKYPSEFLGQYTKYMGGDITKQQRKLAQEILRANNVMIDQSNFRASLQFEIIQTDLQSFSLLLHYGIYKLKINIFMIELNHNYFNSLVISSGSYGKIYSVMKQGKYFAVKQILFKKQTNLEQELLKVYKQYFLCSIASMLSVGPKVSNLFGYDIVVTRQSAFFAIELCQNYTKQKQQKIKRDSIQNLRILHSLKFIHLDIKPANLAYSLSFKKCVFIDFGLSLFIQTDVGFKTFSNFIGTLAYCSEEMKNLYFLHRKKIIDLYYNDVISLKNTLEEINDISNDDSWPSQTIYYQQESKINTIEESITVFLLKFYFFSANLHKIIQILPKFNILPKSFFAILNNKTAQLIINKNEHIKDQITKIRCQITQEKGQNISIINSMNIDNILSQALQKINQNQGFYQLKITSQTLNLSNQQFKLLLKNQLFIVNIILYLDNFSKESNKNIEKQKKVLKLIKKVNESNQYQCFIDIYEQIGYFLKSLNKYLVKKRNYKMLEILRMLFIRMEDFKSIQPLEDEIITQITNPISKCLKIIQFLLFWQLFFDILKYYKINSWIQLIKNLQIQEKNDLFQKIKKYSLIILNNINNKYYDETQSLNLWKFLEPSLSDPLSKQFHQQIIIIKALYEEYYRIERKDFPKIQILSVYSVYFPSVKYFARTSDQQTSFLNLFSSTSRLIQNYNFLNNLEINEKQIQKYIKEIFRRLEGRPDLIHQRFIQNLLRKIEHKSLVFLFFKEYISNFQMLCKTFTIFDELHMIISQKNILRLFLLIKLNRYYFKIQNNYRINEDQRNKLMEQIHLCISLCKQKLPKQNDSSETKSLKICQKLIQLKHKILKNEKLSKQTITQIKKELQQIFPFIIVQNNQNQMILLVFTQILEELIEKIPENQCNYVEDIIIQFCQNQIQRYIFFIFQRGFFTYYYFRINAKRNQFIKNRLLVQLFIVYLEENNLKFKIKFISKNSFPFTLQTFFSFSSQLQLKQIYDEIAFKKEQFERPCFSFYILYIFKELYPKFSQSKQVMLRQLKRSCLCLNRMFHLHALKAKKIILGFCRLPIILQSRRKKLICEKMSRTGIFQLKAAKPNIQLKFHAKLIKNKRVRQSLLQKKIFKQFYWSELD